MKQPQTVFATLLILFFTPTLAQCQQPKSIFYEREWIFFTDTRTFKERYTLVKERGLRGFASWVLGTEDHGIWDLLPSHK